jgi:hypothetical protein
MLIPPDAIEPVCGPALGGNKHLRSSDLPLLQLAEMDLLARTIFFPALILLKIPATELNLTKKLNLNPQRPKLIETKALPKECVWVILQKRL